MRGIKEVLRPGMNNLKASGAWVWFILCIVAWSATVIIGLARDVPLWAVIPVLCSVPVILIATLVILLLRNRGS